MKPYSKCVSIWIRALIALVAVPFHLLFPLESEFVYGPSALLESRAQSLNKNTYVRWVFWNLGKFSREPVPSGSPHRVSSAFKITGQL